MARGWKKLHHEQLNKLSLSSSHSIIRTIKSRKVRWTGHVYECEIIMRRKRRKKVYDFCGKARRRETTRKVKNIEMDMGIDWTELAHD
jgi:hypothetical protein